MIRQSLWWRSITSLNVALIVLIALALIAALSSLFPVLPPDAAVNADTRESFLQAARDKYGLRAELYGALGLFNIYRAGWFWAVLGAAALLTLACALNRLPARRTGDAALRWPRFDSFLIHLGGAAIIAAAGWSTQGAWRSDDIVLPPGQATEVAAAWPHALRCDDFSVTLYPDGQPQDYRAALAVLTDGREVLKHELRVNHPLNYDGVGFYLKSYGAAVTLQATGAQGVPLTMHTKGHAQAVGALTLPISPGETHEIELPDLGLTLRLAPSSRSEESLQGGYFAEAVDQSGETIAVGVALPGKEFEVGQATFSLTQGHYVVVQAIRDPGFWPAILGAVAILLGAALRLLGRRGSSARRPSDG